MIKWYLGHLRIYSEGREVVNLWIESENSLHKQLQKKQDPGIDICLISQAYYLISPILP